MAVVAACAAVGATKGYDAIWSVWNIPVMRPHFADLRNITSAAESIALGADPLYAHPADPWGRPLNQPRVIQRLVELTGIDEGDTTVVGAAFIVLFVGAVLLLLKPTDHATAAALAAVVVSPAVVIGVERANHDLLIFTLVCLAIRVARRPVISAGVLFVAAALKLFPVFALVYAARYTPRIRTAVFAGFASAFALYLAVNAGDLRQIYEATERGRGVVAYGVGAANIVPALAWTSVVVLCVGAVIFAVRVIRANRGPEPDAMHIDAFRAGAGIYIGTFLLGSNWSYRLMFLILTVPQVVAWCRGSQQRALAVVTLAAMFVSAWSPLSLGYRSEVFVTGLDEAANWVLFGTLLALVLMTAPLRWPGWRTGPREAMDQS